MSLSWRDRLYVALSPSRIDVMRVAGIMRRSAAYAELIPGIEVVAEAPWRGPVAALAEAMPNLAPRGSRCAVVLSNHFCRYTVVPANASLANDQEVEAYARLRLEETYGRDATAQWDVRIAGGAPGTARLACAVDRALMEELRRTCSASGLKLTAVRPLLAASFDHWRSRFGSGSFWFAAAEEGRLCLAGVENYAWHSVVSQRIGRNLGDELRAMLDRALLTAPGMTADTVYLFSRDHPGERLRTVPGLHVLPLVSAEDSASADELARARVFA